MKQYFEDVCWVRDIIFAIVSAAIFGIIYWLALPAIPGWGFMWTLLAALAVPGIIGLFFILDGYENRDGYYAFVCEKCASVFGYYGWFLYNKEREERARTIYEGK